MPSFLTISINHKNYAGVVELVDTLDLGSSDASRGGSSPLSGTNQKNEGID